MATTAAALDAERQVVDRLARIHVLPVLTVTDVGTVAATCQALLDGGVSCVEITYRTAWADEAIRRASQFPGLLVGAGTVVDAEQAVAADHDRDLVRFDRPQRLLGAVLEALGALDAKLDSAGVERRLDPGQQLQRLAAGGGWVDQQGQGHALDLHASAA